MVLQPLPPPMPPALRSTRSITPLAPPSECLGIYRVGFFGPALTFAAKSMEHTANQLWQWAKEPDLGVKSIADSILSKSRSICIPYQGVLLDRTSNPGEHLFSVPSPAAEIAATESDAATVLRKSTWVTKLENPFRLLLSAQGSRLR